MALYSKGVYPELSYQERAENTMSAKTYDALINILRLRDSAEGKIPVRISDETEQRAMNWFFKLMAIEYKNTQIDVTDTSLTTVYTTPTATSAIVKSIRVVNLDPSNAAIVSLNMVTSAGTSFALDVNRTISAETSDEFMKATADSFHSNPIILEASEALKIQNSAAGQLNVIASIMEVTNDI